MIPVLFDQLPEAPAFPVSFQEEKYFEDRPRSIDQLFENLSSYGLYTRGVHLPSDE